LEDLYLEGVLKSLGVSNFDSNELKSLVGSAQRVKPMVVQNKMDVYHVGKQLDNRGDTLVEYARSQNIIGNYLAHVLWNS
jgi:diketogulonate reductase-like aldo/keto reductase